MKGEYKLTLGILMTIIGGSMISSTTKTGTNNIIYSMIGIIFLYIAAPMLYSLKYER